MLDFLLSEKIVKSAIVILVLFVFYFIFNRIMKRIFKLKTGIKKLDSKKNKTIISLINNIMKYFLIIVGIITIMSIHGVDTSSLIASLGVASAVIALAFQDTIKDLLAGIFIVLENQYNIGDTIKINNFKGEVVSLGLRTTKLRAFTGEYCFITNRNVDNVINYSVSKSLAVVNVEVSYDSDLNKVEKVLTNLFEKVEKENKNIKGKINIDGVDELGNSGITIRISVETTPLKNYEVERKLRKEIKMEFDKHGIEIPYPQVVIHND